MNISREDTGTLTATLKIELGKGDYEEKVNKTLRDQQRKAQMPGFRPGKVPFGIIKKMYGKAVMLDEINNILGEKIQAYITDNNIKIIGNPLPNKEKSTNIDLDHDTEFEFFFDLGLVPEFNLNLAEDFSLPYYDIKADEDMVEENVSELRTRMGGHSHPDEIADKDVAQGEFVELDAEGQAREGGIVNKGAIAVDLIKDEKVKKEFIGLKNGEKVRFNPVKAVSNISEAAHMLGIKHEEAEQLDADFEFTLDEITRHELAEINEDLYKAVFPEEEIKDEPGFRAKVKEAIEKSLVKESDRFFLHEATDKLLDTTEIPLPEDFLRQWIKEGSETEMSDEEIDKEFEKFEKSVRWQLIEGKLMEDHGLKVEKEEMRNVVKDYFNGQMYFSATDEESESRLNKIIDSVLDNKEESGKIYDQVFEAKLMDLFKNTMKLEHKDISYKDYVNLVSNHKH